MLLALGLVAALLVLPGLALSRLGVDLRWAGAYALVMSALAYWAYARDKQRARQGEWRIPEWQLHGWELLGGWPGAWLAQRRLRHKCSKASYQCVFWLIVLGYQFAAYDALQDWKLSRQGRQWLRQQKWIEPPSPRL